MAYEYSQKGCLAYPHAKQYREAGKYHSLLPSEVQDIFKTAVALANVERSQMAKDKILNAADQAARRICPEKFRDPEKDPIKYRSLEDMIKGEKAAYRRSVGHSEWYKLTYNIL